MSEDEISSKRKTKHTIKTGAAIEIDESNVIDSSRKNNFLSLKDKAEILQRLDQGALASNLAREYGISKSTVSRFKKKKDVIQQAVTTTFPNNTERRTMRGTLYKKTEAALYQWYLAQKQKNVNVTSSMLREKAQVFYNQCEETNYSFCASAGWLNKFRRRYGIQLPQNHTPGPSTLQALQRSTELIDLPILEDPTSICEKVKKIAKSSQFVDKKEAIRCIDTLVRWSNENTIDSLYLTMLRSLKNQIKCGSKIKHVHK